ncbi:MAG: CoA transferase [Desulfuromonadales bacterium]|nr:CoA transferase [Desulfuromonadales bacterium]
MSKEIKKPLEGVRIIDMTAWLSGPYATEIFAYLGAEVIKIEKHVGGDAVRSNGPYFGPKGITFKKTDPKEISLCILKRSRGKKSVSLNLKAEKGKEILAELIKTADIVAENFLPGTMEKLGFGYEDLKKLKSDIILGSCSGFGQDGPYKHFAAFDPVVEAMSGVMEVTGYPEQPPVRLGVAGGDLIAALYMVIGLQAALRYRDQTGKGQHVDVSMMDSLVSFLMEESLDVYVDNNIPIRTGNRRLRLTPFNSYECKDGYATICSAADSHWAGLCRAMGREELINDPRCQKLDHRQANADFVDNTVEAWTRTLPKHEVVDKVRAAGCAAGSVATIPEVLADPQLAHRGMITDLYHPELGKVIGAKGHDFPFRFSELKGGFDLPGGYLGSHNEEVLSELLGYSKEQVEQLKKDDII